MLLVCGVMRLERELVGFGYDRDPEVVTCDSPLNWGVVEVGFVELKRSFLLVLYTR